MKSITKYLLLLVIAGTVFSSCEQKVEGALFDSNNQHIGFSFASTVLNVETSASDYNVIRVPIYRVKNSGNMISVSCLFYDKTKDEYVENDPNRIFRFTTPRVIFSDDSNIGYAQISYSDIEALGVTDKYQMKLKIAENVSYGGTQETNVTISRRLTFNPIGKGTFYDEFLFYKTYDVEIQKAEEANVYRVMDPFSEGLVAEDYVKNGWYTAPSRYVQIEIKSDNSVRFDEFVNGMYFQARYVVCGINPPERTENLDKDLSSFHNSFDGKTITLYPFYYIKNYGFFDCFPMVITLPISNN